VGPGLPYVLLFITWLVLMVAGFALRRRRGGATDRAFGSKLLWVSTGLAAALTATVLPAAWLFLSFSLYGGTIESNVPPGYAPHFMLTILLVGAGFTAMSAIYGYIEHLLS
jgi:hypothetical protein